MPQKAFKSLSEVEGSWLIRLRAARLVWFSEIRPTNRGYWARRSSPTTDSINQVVNPCFRKS